MKSMMRYMQLHQKATPVFVLVRSSTFKTSIDNMFRRFALHSKVDPWIKLYVSQYYPKLSEKGLKHYMDMPKFAVKVLTSFNIFGDVRQTTYVADFISQSWHVDVREPYLAEANFIRARRTFSVHKMCLSYFVVMHIEYPKNKPRFTEGDGIKLVSSLCLNKTSSPVLPFGRESSLKRAPLLVGVPSRLLSIGQRLSTTIWTSLGLQTLSRRMFRIIRQMTCRC